MGRHDRTILAPEKTRYPSYRRLGGPHGRSGRMRKISSPTGFDPHTVQPVARSYKTELYRSKIVRYMELRRLQWAGHLDWIGNTGILEVLDGIFQEKIAVESQQQEGIHVASEYKWVKGTSRKYGYTEANFVCLLFSDQYNIINNSIFITFITFMTTCFGR
jgi:hypothetical protein